MNRILARLSLLYLVAAAMVLAPPPALAADCGGPTLCACGDTVTANHTLTCNVDPVTIASCAGDGLTVNADIALNLGGCTLRSAGGGIGVQLGQGASVAGGRIIAFDIGVLAADETIVRGLRISETGIAGIDTVASSDVVIERNVLQRNENIGIRLFAAHVTVRHNRIEESRGCGITANGLQIVVERNLLLRNGACGILVSGPAGTVSRNQVKDTLEGPGFIFVDAQAQHVTLNRSLNAADPGVTMSPHGFLVLSSSTDNTFERNVASHNDGVGILDLSAGTGTAGTANTYDQNHCVGNGLGDSLPAGLCH